MHVVPAFLAHVAAAFRKVDARVPSPLDILADAAAMVAEGASKSVAPSALDATVTALVASPSLEFNISLPDPYTGSDTSTIIIKDCASDVCMDSDSCTPDASFRVMNLDDDPYSPRPRRRAAKKVIARKIAKTLSIGKENKPQVAKASIQRTTTRPRRLSSTSTSSSSTASSNTLGSPQNMDSVSTLH